MTTWHSAKELAGLPGMPGTVQGVLNRAKKDAWKSRKRNAVGGGNEYAFASLPTETQAALSLQSRSTPQATADVLDAITAPVPPSDGDREAMWAHFERKNQKQKDMAAARLRVLLAIDELTGTGVTRLAAIDTVASLHAVNRATIYRWEQMVLPYDKQDWLAALVPGYTATKAFAEVSPAAWEYFKGDYLRLESPGGAAAYERLLRVAAKQGWTVPSLRSLMRRLKAEIPKTVRTLAREGERALKVLSVTQTRDRSALHAMEAVNADGHKFDVFVRWPDGEIARPIMLALQDLYSGKMLAYALERGENVDAVRRAFGAMAERYGIPEQIVLDNGRAFASKWFSGGAKTRFRFKVQPWEPNGVLTQLGVKIHWATPFHGQAKPIERAFRDLAEYVAKHPVCAGAYTGNKPDAKPENYGSTAVPLDTFAALLEQEVIAHNARSGRRTTVCQGRSFDDVFEESYATATVRKCTEHQRRLWMLSTEAVTVQRNASVRLHGNVYYDEKLIEHIGERVVLRFADDELHKEVHAYALDGRFLCTVPCSAAVSFFDAGAAREVARQRRAQLRHAKKALGIQRRLSAAEVAAMLPELAAPELPPAAAVQMVRPVAHGNAALAVERNQAQQLEHANDQVNSAVMRYLQARKPTLISE